MLFGEVRQWLSHFRSLEEQLVLSIEAVWPLCVVPLRARDGAMAHEDHITNHLVAALIRSKRIPGRIIPQYTLLVEREGCGTTLSSNIDFVLTIGDDEAVYLACECKRLNVPYEKGMRGLVGEYVNGGLMRFISGQYSDGLPLAMMLGYVMNARVDRARRGLRRAMAVRSDSIKLKATREFAGEVGRPLRFTTTHECLSGHTIEVTHTLLGWP